MADQQLTTTMRATEQPDYAITRRQAATRTTVQRLLSRHRLLSLILAGLAYYPRSTVILRGPRRSVVCCAFAPPRGAVPVSARRRAAQTSKNDSKSFLISCRRTPLLGAARTGGGAGGAGGLSPREAEIRRKIAALKRQGRIQNKQKASDGVGAFDDQEDEDTDEEVQEAIASMVGGTTSAGLPVDYEARIRAKLGTKTSRLLGYGGSAASGDDDASGVEGTMISESQSEDDEGPDRRLPMIGSLPSKPDDESLPSIVPQAPQRRPIINPDLFDEDGSDEDDKAKTNAPEDEKALIDLVERKMLEKRARERREEEQRIRTVARQKLAELQQESSQASVPQPKQLTTGVGGSWTPPPSQGEAEPSTKVEFYQPKSGSWGAFPRPKDISQAYGGGRRIGPGFSNEAERLQSEQETRDRLQRYREKVGIDVPSEREHASDIDEALRIAGYAMQRGRYSTGVSALEKVTKYCSTNSKVGGKVFLELAMAYEAVGRTEEAIVVYRTLSTSRIEDVKFNAKRLLYGIEAMQFMQNDVKSPEFSRRRARNTFIDTTGFGNIASHFDDVYQTAYVDMEGGFYKKLTESVVRSTREARQILLRATDSGEVQRPRVVQALRSIARSFDDALESEIQRNTAPEPVAVINGVPILAATMAGSGSGAGSSQASSPFSSVATRSSTINDEFVMMDPSSMLANLDGEWRLQLLADKRGDGVKYFNSSIAWQSIDTANQTFCSSGPSGFATVQRAGRIEFNEKRRILRRRAVQESGGGVLSLSLSPLFLGSKGGFGSAVQSPQQILSVDSVLLITRGIPNRRVRQDDGEKDYFAVWRRVERGTLSSSKGGF